MNNFKLTIEYDGSAYNGWQRQTEAPTVQAEIERALGSMTHSTVTLLGAGRTDAGVHALGQVASFRCETRLSPEEILKGLNSLLPRDIAIRGCCRMPDDFHARFSAKSKRYHYRILNRTTRAAVGRDYAWFIHRPLDVTAMGQAAERLIGLQDFKAFESAGSPRAHTRRHVMQAVWVEEPEDRCLTFRIEARDEVESLALPGPHRFPEGAGEMDRQADAGVPLQDPEEGEVAVEEGTVEDPVEVADRLVVVDREQKRQRVAHGRQAPVWR